MFVSKYFAILSETITAPSGMYPLVRPFAHVTMSAYAEVLRGQPFSGAPESGHHSSSISRSRICRKARAAWDSNRPEAPAKPLDPVMPSTMIGGDGVRPFHLNHFFNVADTFAMACLTFWPNGQR